MTKAETKALLELIEKSQIIRYKSTNAATNKLKIKEWNRITELFNSFIISSDRTPQQLRLKWENLKKSARKRRSDGWNHIQTENSKITYIPPDEILDRVTAILERPVNEFIVNVEITQESEDQTPIEESDEVLSENGDSYLSGDTGLPAVDVPNPFEVSLPETGHIKKERKRKLFPRFGGKRTPARSDEGRTARNVAIAKYYTMKRKLVEVKLDNLQLENEKTKLDIKKFKKAYSL